MDRHPMRMHRIGINGVVLLLSLALSLLVSEMGARLLLNPADYLSVTIVRDEVLGIRVAGGTRGFDDWGFRNPSVPAKADIVAIGDSHTYGNNATMAESWPSVGGRLTGWSVYNLGLGGYGPNQYYHLLTTRALQLKPRWVVCGLYMGDDFENAFLMTYGHDYWSGLRTGQWGRADADIWERADDTTWQRSARAWLSRNSVIYRLIVHGPVLGRLKGALQIRRAEDGMNQEVSTLTVREMGIREAFRPAPIRERLDQRSGLVREGMRITFELLRRMDRACQGHDCRLLVVLIPTKETVFADYLLRERHAYLQEVIADLVSHEEIARGRLMEFLDEAGIPYLDVLPALRGNVARELYTRSDGDMHPNGNGYRVIGEAVAEFLKTQQGSRSERMRRADAHG